MQCLMESARGRHNGWEIVFTMSPREMLINIRIKLDGIPKSKAERTKEVHRYLNDLEYDMDLEVGLKKRTTELSEECTSVECIYRYYNTRAYADARRNIMGTYIKGDEPDG